VVRDILVRAERAGVEPARARRGGFLRRAPQAETVPAGT
jgi:hypothetical protein